jgi:hypothetical protein
MKWKMLPREEREIWEAKSLVAQAPKHSQPEHTVTRWAISTDFLLKIAH